MSKLQTVNKMLDKSNSEAYIRRKTLEQTANLIIEIECLKQQLRLIMDRQKTNQNGTQSEFSTNPISSQVLSSKNRSIVR